MKPGSSSRHSSGNFVVSKANFDSMFPHKIRFYTYSDFVSATISFPAFANTGSLEQKKQEAAAFLANVAHESGSLQYVRESNTANYDNYTENSAIAYGDDGRKIQYYGRGPLQLSWDYNYRDAGKYLRTNLLHNPDRVATDSTVAWKAALWFWMERVGKGGMTAHDAMTANGAKNDTKRFGFGETICAINGGMECGGKNRKAVTSRVNYYKQFVSILGTDVGPGELRC